ncbi:MAG: putative ABC transporter permease [Eggerthellaceae bacterium]|nr:putative ABC transporter permease [Eggerthellaceae bacterium]
MENDHAMDAVKLPLAARVFGVLCLLGSVSTLPATVVSAVDTFELFQIGGLNELYASTVVVVFLMMAVEVAMAVTFLILGIRLLRNRRRYAAVAAEVIAVLAFVAALCDIMLFGIREWNLLFFLVTAALGFALASYFDPSLAEERDLRQKLRDMENRDRAEDGTLGLDETGKGYITLNFFNMFWIFVACSIFGVVFETLWHMILVVPGEYQDRAGLLFGPFSPIYGFGALLMTIALNRFHDRSFVLIFVVSAVIGGAFEYFVSWFMEYSFGAVAWDYTGRFLNINGRTSFSFMCIWGVLGVVWIKAALPQLLRLVNLIPWNLRYTATVICAILMITNGIMTLQALDCWSERTAGRTPTTPIELFYADNFDNAYMEHRFQTISLQKQEKAGSIPPSRVAPFGATANACVKAHAA